MNKAGIEQTLRRSKEVEERYKKFLAEKEQSDKQWEVTEAKLQKTLAKLAETKNTIKQIDDLYTNYQKSFDNAINSALQRIQATKLLEIPDPNFTPHYISGKQVANKIRESTKIVILTGAGVSASSGIPTFRDHDGFWSKKKQEGITPEQFLTKSHFQRQPFAIWEWIDEFNKTKTKCKPNAGHFAIDQICAKQANKKRQFYVITQNIDNYHIEAQKLGKKYPIFEIHGNTNYVRCDNCTSKKQEIAIFPWHEFKNEIKNQKNPICPECKQKLRPHIMFFDEMYEQKINKSDSIKGLVEKADLLFVIGTALQTGLARMIVQKCLENKIAIVQINIECKIRQNGVEWMNESSEKALVNIFKEV